jgi:SAM-dependent methyltransferase
MTEAKTEILEPAENTVMINIPAHRCRFCGIPLQHTFVDLGMSPLCETYRTHEQLNQMEPFYPLHVYVCAECFLVQLPEYVKPYEIYNEYAYFSSYSDSWLDHARKYVEMAVKRFGLDEQSNVVEIASNDGYLLQYFMERGIPVLGVEPAANVAEAAINKNIPTLVEFFGEATARDLASHGKNADLLLGNNVLAHVPDINGFIKGLKILLAPAGVITMEFPHLMRLMEGNQFDTIYHEHFSYLSFLTACRMFENHKMQIFDVEELPTHGGSLRIFAQHSATGCHAVGSRVHDLKHREEAAGFGKLEHYLSFTNKVQVTKRNLLEFLIQAKRRGKSVVGYGAPGKGNTLLNYCGIRTDFLDYTVDRNPYKHGKFLPGTGIPIFPPDHIEQTKPNYVLILPWNLKDEIVTQLKYIRSWGGQFVIPIPTVQVIP